MSTIELRNIAQAFLDNADDKLLKLYIALGKEYNNQENHIGYSYTENKPLTTDNITERVLISENEIKAKKTITIEELEKEMKNW